MAKTIFLTKEQLRTIIGNEYPNLSNEQKNDLIKELVIGKKFTRSKIQELAENKIIKPEEIKTFKDMDKIEEKENKNTLPSKLKCFCWIVALILAVIIVLIKARILNFEYSWLDLTVIGAAIVLGIFPFLSKVSIKGLEFQTEK